MKSWPPSSPDSPATCRGAVYTCNCLQGSSKLLQGAERQMAKPADHNTKNVERQERQGREKREQSFVKPCATCIVSTATPSHSVRDSLLLWKNVPTSTWPDDEPRVEHTLRDEALKGGGISHLAMGKLRRLQPG